MPSSIRDVNVYHGELKLTIEAAVMRRAVIPSHISIGRPWSFSKKQAATPIKAMNREKAPQKAPKVNRAGAVPGP